MSNLPGPERFPDYEIRQENGRYVVYRTESKEGTSEEVIDSFDTEEEAIKVKNGLNDGYFYSKEFGIECWMELTERIFNDRGSDE